MTVDSAMVFGGIMEQKGKNVRIAENGVRDIHTNNKILIFEIYFTQTGRQLSKRESRGAVGG